MDAAWPRTLYLSRHGESEANVANAVAIASGAGHLGPVDDDRLVRLTERGVAQARALGAYFERAEQRPEFFISSPFERCYATAVLAARACGIPESAVKTDERLRERALGMLDRLTPAGIRERYPEEAQRRRDVGKFAYRPPHGESWADVAERLRPFCADLRAAYGGQNVAVVTHQAVLLCMRMVLESLSVDELYAIDLAGDVGHCTVTMYAGSGDALELVAYNVDPAATEYSGA